jgi:glc operon protein GlcG
MHRSFPITSVLAFALFLFGPAAAQQQPAAPATPPANAPAGGTPEASPFNIPYGVSIGGEKAKQLLAAIEAEAKKRNWPEVIAVVDTNGDLVAFLRMDGAQVGSVGIAQGKARTAARYRRPTQTWYNLSEAGHSYFTTLDQSIAASPGGFPLVEGGKVIGAVGCSGGTGDQDALLCKIGAEMVK